MLEYPSSIVERYQRGDLSGALVELQGCLERNPDDAPALHLFGLICLQAQRADIALTKLRRASELLKHPQVLLHHACCCEVLNLDDEALIQVKEALERDPANLETTMTLVRLLEKKESYGEAITTLLQALKFNGHHSEIEEKIKKIYFAIDRCCKAPYRNNFPLLFIGMGHSAGAYITMELSKRLDMHFALELFALGPGHMSYLDTARLDQLVINGGLSHTHMFPFAYNVTALKSSGIKRVVVHIRDPRQFVYSNVPWMSEVRRRASDPHINRYELPLLMSHLGQNFFQLSFKEQVDWMIERELPEVVGWIQGWIDAERTLSPEVEVKLTRFEDFKRDKKLYFSSLLDFYKIDPSEWRGEEVQVVKKDDQEIGSYAFRKGLIDEWRYEMTEDQIRRCNELVPDELLQRCGYTR